MFNKSSQSLRKSLEVSGRLQRKKAWIVYSYDSATDSFSLTGYYFKNK